MNLIDAALSRSRTVISALLLILASGTYAWLTIPKEADPDITIPKIYVTVNHDGISQEDAERVLVRPLEEKLRSVEGVKEMISWAREGGANILLEFDAGFDPDSALLDVREEVDKAKNELPADSDDPHVQEINISLFPVLVVTMAGPVPERAMLALARDLKDRIEAIPSVLEVKIAGDRDERVEVIVDPMLVESYALDPERMAVVVGRFNQLIAAGAMDTGQGRFSVKVPGVFDSIRDIMKLPVKVEGDAVVTLGDIASVQRTFRDATGFARVNGHPALALEVSKRAGENIIDTIAAVRETVEATRLIWPETVEVTYSQDKSKDIRLMLGDLQNNVISAVLLVMIVVIATLGWRSGFLVGIAIPGSFLSGILVLAAFGMTMNIVVLFALILAVGMLVDGAIVVTEYADRKMTEGEPRRLAYGLAAKRMSWPIIASTATTLAAFLPLLFWPGIVGQFMKYLPITLIATLSASLAMALIFVPTVGAYIGKPGAENEHTAHALAAGSGDELMRLSGPIGLYVRLLAMTLRWPSLILFLAVLTLGGAWYTYGTFGKGVEFFPEVEPDRAMVQIHARGNLSALEQDELVARVEAHVLDIADERGEFITVYTASGKREIRSEEAEDVVGTISLDFVEWNQRRPASVILADILTRSVAIPGIIVETKKEEGGPPVGKPIHIELASDDWERLNPVVDQVRAHIEGMEGLRDIEDSRPISGIEWVLQVDHEQAARFGADVAVIGWFVQMITKGLNISSYRPDNSDEELDIVIRFPEANRTLGQLDSIRIRTELGLVPIGNFVKRVARPKAGTLQRVNMHRVLSVKADVMEGVLADGKVRELREWIAGIELPPGLTYKFKGEDEEQAAAQQFLVKAFGVALFIMAIILVTQFNSFYSGFLILSAVIMSTVGVLLGLLVTGQPFGIVMSGVGVIALAGIVVNNNIVLIDTYDRLRLVEPDAKLALLRTGAQRLRPVLLTTVTTILGLLPMVLSMNIDFFSRRITVGAPSTQWWTQLSSAIAFGLAFATVLTLVVTPSALMARANMRARLDRWGEWRAERRAAKTAKIIQATE
ncbi:MAG: efflux RND transporter permease subunit [Proteobacteria bacterium]|nr:efflux RND transporter permease subunit [Pseudomonadota bacterium]